MTVKATHRQPAACHSTALACRKLAPKPSAAPPAQPIVETVHPDELHRRWQAARLIVRAALGTEDQHDPRIWERGLYQLWLWLVVELLVLERDAVDLPQLSLVSKMLRDHRKLSLDEARRRPRFAGDDGTRTTPQLPAHFGELVRQIYGTNFHSDQVAPETAAAAE
jgi:hypothetical protein